MKINLNYLINSLIILIFCTTRFWGTNLPWYISVIIRIFGIIFLVIINDFKIKVSKKVGIFAKVTILPIILILIYSCFLWFVFGKMPQENVIRNLFTSSAYLLLDVIFATLLYMKYNKKSVDMFVRCGFISYFVGSMIPIIIKSPVNGIIYLFTSYQNGSIFNSYTEINDLTFAMGFCLLYYLFVDKEKRKGKKMNILRCVLLIFWGLKRIEIAAIILCYLFYKFVISKINLQKSSKLATIITMSISYLYIMFIHNNYLIQLASKFNINFMGRLTTYTYVASNYSSFSPKFLGIGFGYIDEILENLGKINFTVNYVPIISLHSDILRMYIGIGFIAFGLWIFYQCYIKTRILEKKVGVNSAKAYLIFTIYLFVLYLTDNTYSYPITFTLYCICTLSSINDSEYIIPDKKV